MFKRHEEDFDYEDYRLEQMEKNGQFEVHENPYENYEIFDVEIIQTIKKKVSVFAPCGLYAEEYVRENIEDIDLDKDIDEYKIDVIAADELSSSMADYTVPIDWEG